MHSYRNQRFLGVGNHMSSTLQKEAVMCPPPSRAIPWALASFLNGKFPGLGTLNQRNTL